MLLYLFSFSFFSFFFPERLCTTRKVSQGYGSIMDGEAKMFWRYGFEKGEWNGTLVNLCCVRSAVSLAHLD